MTCETSKHMPAGATPTCDTMSAAQRLRPPIGATSRPKITAPKRSETRSAEAPATFAVANHAKPSSEITAKRSSSRRAARIAEEQELAALCQRRASQWADAIREGLDADIARFIRDQAAAWRFLATSCARPRETP